MFGLNGNSSKLPAVNVMICNQAFKAYIDSCASVNMMSQADYDKLPDKPKLQTSNQHIFAYGSKQPLHLIGMFSTTIAFNDSCVSDDVYVSQQGATLLSFNTSSRLVDLEKTSRSTTVLAMCVLQTLSMNIVTCLQVVRCSS